MKVDGELGDSFAVGVGVRQQCTKSQWLFNIFMDGCMKEMNVKVGRKNRFKIKSKQSELLGSSTYSQITLCCWQRVQGNFIG